MIMRVIYHFLVGFFYVLGIYQTVGQTTSPNVPKKFTYQSVVRDSSGQLITNHNLRMRLSLQRAPQMTNLYIETHQLTTNSNGLLTCLIGSGQPFFGMMDTIDWSLGNVYIQTEIDLTGGNNFVTLGNQELLSVPYALYSLNSGSSTPGPQGPIGPQGPTGPQGSFPPGTQPGEMNYWNGTTWVSVPPGTRGQFLAFCDGVPTWGGCLPQVTTTLATSITSTGATTGGNVTSDGGASVTARGVAYGTAQNPTTANSITSNGTGTGVFNSTLSGLTSSTLYYVRAYATNAVGTAYGSQVSFTSDGLPTVTTTSATGITSTAAATGGNVTVGLSVTARGVAYGTAQNPTISGTITSNGTGTGVFTSTLSGLTPLTTYYVRAYATNSLGTSYGNEVNFTTDSLPGVRCPGTPSVTDIDGSVYYTVQIGTQCWTHSNLKVSKYRNGDTIPTGLSNSDWQTTTSGAYAIYNNDPVNDGLYGKLYNHYAVTDSRGLCPTGWHVPSDAEWTTLENYLGGSSVAGDALISTATQPTPGGWYSPNAGATNSLGFTALPGGLRTHYGDFHNMTFYGYWWSSSVSSGSNAWNRLLDGETSEIYRYSLNRSRGVSVRCCRD